MYSSTKYDDKKLNNNHKVALTNNDIVFIEHFFKFLPRNMRLLDC